MTIAACHLSPEGVVLGADSTTTITEPGKNPCYFDHEQKLFEVGPPGSTVGLVTWGSGQVGKMSHRSMAARLSAAGAEEPFTNLKQLTERLADLVQRQWTKDYDHEITSAQALAKKIASEPASVKAEEIAIYNSIVSGTTGGYIVGGRVEGSVDCEAFEVKWSPVRGLPVVTQLDSETPIFRGLPFLMERLIFGFDSQILDAILESGKWTGSEDQLVEIASGFQFSRPTHLPLREAIDWIHTVIHTTIRGVKFAKWPHLCGGPIELAVVTTDRPFRWVQHKELDAAIVTARARR